MEKIDFNSDNFVGFFDGKDILVDIGVLFV